MSDWSYTRDESSGFETRIPEGRHRCRIKAAEKAVSSKGNSMLTMQLNISGYAETVYYYLTFLKDNPSFTNQKLTQLFDSFKDIPDGEFDLSKWIGKVGACTIKHEDYNGNAKAKVGYFIHANKQNDLPAWKEVDGMKDGNGGGNSSGDDFMQMPTDLDEEVPFA